MPLRAPTEDRHLRERVLVATIVLASAAALLFRIESMTIPVADDAAISIAYGWSFWTGHGMRITPYSQVTEAFSNPLWTVLTGLWPALGFGATSSASVLGTIGATLALPVVVAWGAASRGGAPRVEDTLPALLACTSSSYAYWAAAGLEGPSVTLVSSLAVLSALHEARSGRARFTGVLLGLLTLVRPEAVAYAGAIAIPILVARRTFGRSERITAAVALGIAAMGYVVRYWTFASLAPNPFYIKHGYDHGRLDYLGRFVASNVPLVVLLGVGIVMALVYRERRLLGGVIGAMLTLVAALFVLEAGGDWMREWRFLAPIVPAAGALPAATLSSMRDRYLLRVLPRDRRSAGVTMAASLAGLLVVATGAQAWQSDARLEEVRRDPTFPAWIVGGFWGAVAEPGRALGLVHLRVGLPDIGGSSLALRDAQIVDLAGLGDWTIARSLRWNLPAVEDYLVHEVRPTLVDVHGPSGDIGRLHDFMRGYEPAGRLFPSTVGYPISVVRGLGPDTDPRCPGGPAAITALAPTTLADAIDARIDASEPEEALGVYRCARERLEDVAMPPADRLAAAAARAVHRRDEAEGRGEIEPALRWSSLATVLAHDDAHLRRHTERLRATLFPPTPIDWLHYDSR